MTVLGFIGAGAETVQGQGRSYLVFFDWDRATLTDRARQIVQEAADSWSGRLKVYVNGYTDTEDGPEYGAHISRARAESVAAELVRLGVPNVAISVTGFGTRNQLVPTGPSVREPQNRRTEIVFLPR